VRKIHAAWVRAKATLRRYFPQHQIYFRTNGNVRFFTISTRVQVACASVAAAIGLTLMGGAASYLFHAQNIEARERQLEQREAQYAAMTQRMAALSRDMHSLKGDVSQVATQIERRQTFLQQLFSRELSFGPGTAKPQRTSETAGLQRPRSAEHAQIMGQYKSLQREQQAFAGTAAQAANARFAQMDAVLRRVGLSAQALLSQSQTGVGGPYVEASFEDGAYSDFEPEFKDLFGSWTRMESLEEAVLSVPSYLPAKNFRLTSGFGFRYDPFHGGAAMHTGLDFAGAHGSPIYAAADGVVVRAAFVAAYGYCIDVDHGHGMTTRYAHLSGIDVRTGDQIRQAQVIGRMGSTGRSTGTHLHYEVRFNGRAVNPMPFLEASSDVLEIQRRAKQPAA
jgi:murein DD-endopeptidase MepM/ murein hydrolase activator NlpD